MKNLIITSILAVLIASATTVRAQDYPEEYLGLPGDNLNLYAVMDLFRNSETLEGFERSLNDPKSRINNLDLNGDNFVDYITVSDYIDRKVHTIVLRAVLGRKEYQDVAVFTVQKLRKKKVMIQLIGDEALYGRNYIIEPVYAKKLRHGYYGDPMYADNVTVINNYYYDIYDWPVIVYIYHPHYRGWHSSWYWGYYPDYWDPWRPYYWDYYYGYHSCWNHHYYTYYHHWDYPRYKGYNDFYYHGIRQQSEQVHHRIAEGNYTETYSRPELRKEGAALYTSTHETRNSESRRAAASVNRTETCSCPCRQQRILKQGGAQHPTVTGKPAATESRDVERKQHAESRDIERRAAESRTAETRAAEERAMQKQEAAEARKAREPGMLKQELQRQEAAATEARAAEAREAQSRAAEARAAEAREAQSRAAEARAAEAREAQSRAAEARAAEAREAQSRAAEARAAEAREAQSRAAEARAAEAREAQSRAAEARAAEAREAQSRAAEARAAEAREAERKSAENREAEAKATEARRSSGNTDSSIQAPTAPIADNSQTTDNKSRRSPVCGIFLL